MPTHHFCLHGLCVVLGVWQIQVLLFIALWDLQLESLPSEGRVTSELEEHQASITYQELF